MDHEPANKASTPFAGPAGFVPRLASFPAQAPVIPGHELLVRIGGGSYGQVWLARNVMGTLRAVKVVWRTTFEQAGHFEREYKGLQKFEPISRSHEGLVDILQVGRDEAVGYFYYVMELADDAAANLKSDVVNKKETLKPGFGTGPESTEPSDSYSPRTLRGDFHRGPLPADECVALGLKLTAALEHLHQNGLVHRDIKPSNIIFVKGEPKLADIGLVTAIGEAQSLVGTVGYIPPEGPGSAQADLYSLGKVLYEAALGKDRQDFPQLPPDLPSHPEYAALLELNEVILKACESDSRRRYRSAREMHDDLALLDGGRSVRRKRALQQRWALGSKVGLVAIALALLALLPFLRGLSRGHIPDPQTSKLYDNGRWHYSQLTPEDHVQALELLTQAVERDPKFVQPYADLVAVHVWGMLPGLPTEQARLERVRAIYTNAAAIEPNSAEAHVALSFCHFLERDWRGAESEIVRAIGRNPNLAIAHDLYAFYLECLDRFQECHREAERAEALEPPGSLRLTAIVGAWPYIGERRFDGAIAQLQQVVQLDKKFANGHYYLFLCYEAQSNYVAAIEELRQAGLMFGLDEKQVTTDCDRLRQAYDTQGEKGYLQKWIELVEAEASLPPEKRGICGDTADRDLAGHYARLGEKEKALDQLEKHFDEPNVWQQVRFLPLHDSLRGDPRFEALIKRAGLVN